MICSMAARSAAPAAFDCESPATAGADAGNEPATSSPAKAAHAACVQARCMAAGMILFQNDDRQAAPGQKQGGRTPMQATADNHSVCAVGY